MIHRIRNRRLTKKYKALKNEAWHIFQEQMILVEYTSQFA